MADDVVLMICTPGAEPLGRTIAQRVVDGWPEADRPELSITTIDELPDDPLSGLCPIIWLVDAGCTDPPLGETLERLATLNAPTMLTREGERHPPGTCYQPGVVLAPPDLDAAALRALVRTLISQAQNVACLRQELYLTQRHQGGLRGQINKLDEELRLAAQVQHEFLPSEVPRVGDVDVQVLFRPASYVSGDIYDVQRLDEQHIGMWIADVVGHGVPAALLTMFVRRALPTKEITADSYRLIAPDEALARLNHEMSTRAADKIRFATACYAVINCFTHEMQLARAGHPYPMLLRASGRTEMLKPDGPLLGVFPEDHFECRTYQIEPGDRLLLYSDGFETAFGDGESHDLARYRREFARLRTGTPEQAIAHLDQLISAQPGSLHQADDLTVVMASAAPTRTDASVGEPGAAELVETER